MMPWVGTFEKLSKPVLISLGLVVLAGIGLVDYWTGFEIMFSAFYLLEVGLATWFVGKGFGWMMSLLSVIVWVGGDVAAGARYSSSLVPVWNGILLLVLYGIVVWILSSLRSLHMELAARVKQRTQALEHEMAQRQRLEEELLQISEREQRRIGHDLHDGLCQHLAATAMAGQVLSERLAGKDPAEAAAAQKVVGLIEEGISLARNLARGLYPVETEAEGLMAAFQELAATMSQAARMDCVFDCGSSAVLVHNSAVATHLYRIAQEAVRNAVRHGKAKHVRIQLLEEAATLKLCIEDDGVGLPETPPVPGGLGIRIMAYRAGLLGGAFAIEPALTGGTLVTCTVPRTSLSTPNAGGNHAG